MKRPGQMLKQVLASAMSKPVTILYPTEKITMPEKFRGRLKFCAEKCIGCKLCVKDCPAGAISIRKVGEKQFEADIDMAKCIYCGQCVDSCMKDALEMTGDFELASLSRATLRVTGKRLPTTDDPAQPQGGGEKSADDPAGETPAKP